MAHQSGHIHDILPFSGGQKWALAIVATATCLLQSWVAYLAGSSAVQADAMDAAVHSAWYSGPIFITIWMWLWKPGKTDQIVVGRWYGTLNAVVLYSSLTLVLLLAVKKIIHGVITINPSYMLLGGFIGIIGGKICLWVLNRAKYKGHTNGHNRTYMSFIGHATSDLFISYAVSITAIIYVEAEYREVIRFYLDKLLYLDPILSILAVVWIGYTNRSIWKTN